MLLIHFNLFLLVLLVFVSGNELDIGSSGSTTTPPTIGATLYHTTTFDHLKQWVTNHRDSQYHGIIISTHKRTIYPEVTGYYIPTLLAVGEYTMAEEFGVALARTQRSDGSFGLGDRGFVFDTLMVVRGLNALVVRQPTRTEFVQVLKNACKWLVEEIDPRTNRWVVPEGSIWGLPSGRGRVSEGIHLLGIVPLRTCGHILQNQKYIDFSYAMEKRIMQDLGTSELVDFTHQHHLSHFYAYIMEALQELGHHELVQKGMAIVGTVQQLDGSVPAYSNVEWVCSTGLAQFALVWYRMGDPASLMRADRALFYLFEHLQHKKTYGFTGSVGKDATYFPFQEISWAVKYAIDALLAVPVAHFNHRVVHTFPTRVLPEDDRLNVLVQVVEHVLQERQRRSVVVVGENGENGENGESEKETLDVLDVGCGKGRFANALKLLYPADLRITGSDISPTMLRMAFQMSLQSNHFVESSATSLPFPSASFDIIYLIESMEHVLFVNATLQECHRLLRENGVLVLIDKTTDDVHQRSLLWELETWERWYGIKEMELWMQSFFGVSNVNSKRLDMDEGLFVAWTGIKN